MKAKDDKKEKRIFAEVKTPSAFFQMIRETYDAIDARDYARSKKMETKDES